MNSTGDKITDALLSTFRDLVRPVIQRGVPVNMDYYLEQAAVQVGRVFRGARKHNWKDDELIRKQCRKIILDIEKRERLLDIRKTGVGALLDDFIKESHYEIHYKLRGNNTAGIMVRIPSSSQTLCINISFKKIMSEGWLDTLQADLDEFMRIVDKFGRIRVTR